MLNQVFFCQIMILKERWVVVGVTVTPERWSGTSQPCPEFGPRSTKLGPSWPMANQKPQRHWRRHWRWKCRSFLEPFLWMGVVGRLVLTLDCCCILACLLDEILMWTVAAFTLLKEFYTKSCWIDGETTQKNFGCTRTTWNYWVSQNCRFNVRDKSIVCTRLYCS